MDTTKVYTTNEERAAHVAVAEGQRLRMKWDHHFRTIKHLEAITTLVEDPTTGVETMIEAVPAKDISVFDHGELTFTDDPEPLPTQDAAKARIKVILAIPPANWTVAELRELVVLVARKVGGE